MWLHSTSGRQGYKGKEDQSLESAEQQNSKVKKKKTKEKSKMWQGGKGGEEAQR